MLKSRLAGVLFAVLFVFSVTAAYAAEEKISLGSELSKAAKGEAIIKDLEYDRKEVTVNVSGLQPNSIYTVWFVTEEPKMDMAGVGQKDFSFKTDAKGNAKYSATVSESEIQKWEKLEVAFHPDGNPRNMENIQIALEGDLGR